VNTSKGDNSRNPEKHVIVVGSETNAAGTAERNSATARDNAARVVFSSVVLETESKADYDSLVTGLRYACQPSGTLEEILVEKLAAILWRHRRVIARGISLDTVRFEASLERAFDRTLAQLERLQEIRLARPVTRPLKFGIPA
jgi:hypothetical protein